MIKPWCLPPNLVGGSEFHRLCSMKVTRRSPQRTHPPWRSDCVGSCGRANEFLQRDPLQFLVPETSDRWGPAVEVRPWFWGCNAMLYITIIYIYTYIWVCQGTLYNPMVLKIMAHFKSTCGGSHSWTKPYWHLTSPFSWQTPRSNDFLDGPSVVYGICGGVLRGTPNHPFLWDLKPWF